MSLPSTAELLYQWDAERPRSQQAEMGMSALGGCRRRAGYHLKGYPQDDEFEPNHIQAILGTAIHEAAADAARRFVPGALVEELEVHFGGLTGHPDLVYEHTVRDIKTVGYSLVLEQRRHTGPPLRERFQVHTYCAALIVAGYDVNRVEIDYIDRGSGDDYLFSEPFDPDVVAAAMAWLDDVRRSDITLLNRDFRPESGMCKACPWFRQCWDAEPGKNPRSVLFLDEPDLAVWALRHEQAKEQQKAAKGQRDDAEGALSAVCTVTTPGEVQEVEVPGLDRLIRFKINKGKSSPDMAAIAIDYERAGARPPMKVGAPVVSITLVAKKESE